MHFIYSILVQFVKSRRLNELNQTTNVDEIDDYSLMIFGHHHPPPWSVKNTDSQTSAAF